MKRKIWLAIVVLLLACFVAWWAIQPSTEEIPTTEEGRMIAIARKALGRSDALANYTAKRNEDGEWGVWLEGTPRSPGGGSPIVVIDLNGNVKRILWPK